MGRGTFTFVRLIGLVDVLATVALFFAGCHTEACLHDSFLQYSWEQSTFDLVVVSIARVSVVLVACSHLADGTYGRFPERRCVLMFAFAMAVMFSGGSVAFGVLKSLDVWGDEGTVLGDPLWLVRANLLVCGIFSTVELLSVIRLGSSMVGSVRHPANVFEVREQDPLLGDYEEGARRAGGGGYGGQGQQQRLQDDDEPLYAEPGAFRGAATAPYATPADYAAPPPLDADGQPMPYTTRHAVGSVDAPVGSASSSTYENLGSYERSAWHKDAARRAVQERRESDSNEYAAISSLAGRQQPAAAAAAVADDDEREVARGLLLAAGASPPARVLGDAGGAAAAGGKKRRKKKDLGQGARIAVVPRGHDGDDGGDGVGADAAQASASVDSAGSGRNMVAAAVTAAVQEAEAEVAEEAEMRHRKRTFIARELLSTEETYVRGLDVLVDAFVKPLRASCEAKTPVASPLEGVGGDVKVPPAPVLEAPVLRSMFADVEAILNINRSLLHDLRDRIEVNWTPTTCIGSLFQQYISFFKLYINYVNNYETSSDAIALCVEKNPRFAAWADQTARSAGAGRLQALLIIPVQRIPRYVLLLEDLVKKTPLGHSDYGSLKQALEGVRQVASTINEAKRATEKRLRMLEIQSKVKNAPDIIVPRRTFLEEWDCVEFALAFLPHSKAKINKKMLKSVREGLSAAAERIADPDRPDGAVSQDVIEAIANAVSDFADTCLAKDAPQKLIAAAPPCLYTSASAAAGASAGEGYIAPCHGRVSIHSFLGGLAQRLDAAMGRVPTGCATDADLEAVAEVRAEARRLVMHLFNAEILMQDAKLFLFNDSIMVATRRKASADSRDSSLASGSTSAAAAATLSVARRPFEFECILPLHELSVHELGPEGGPDDSPAFEVCFQGFAEGSDTPVEVWLAFEAGDEENLAGWLARVTEAKRDRFRNIKEAPDFAV